MHECKEEGRRGISPRIERLTIASSCTLVIGISASMSITFAIDAGMASYVGALGVGADWGAGRDAARAAAMDVAAAISKV